MIKKICYVRQHKTNGIESYSDTLVSALRNLGIEVIEEWPIPRKPITTRINSSFDLVFIEDVHLVATHLSEIRTKTPIVSVFHHLMDPVLLPKSIEMSNAVICVSEFSANILARQRITSTKINVIHNGIDTDLFSPDVDRVFNKDDIVLFSPQFGIKSKGSSMVEMLSRKLDPSRFSIEVTSRSPQFFRQDQIIHCNGRLPRDEFIDLFRSSDILLFPTTMEGFGLVAAEALALGIPVVTSKGTAVEEIINDETGALCDPFDLDKMHTAIINLVDDEEKFNVMKVKCRERALNLFSLNLMVSKYLEVFEQIKRPQPF